VNLNELNSVQAEAVEYVDSPLLIFAGAGSGKTRVLAYKIAYLIDDKGLSPDSILAVTFTNKAAKEMRNRVDALLGQREKDRGKTAVADRTLPPGGNVHVGTFHSICARILRRKSSAWVIGRILSSMTRMISSAC